jgi:cardiolipin synthase (CMP-forming)
MAGITADPPMAEPFATIPNMLTMLRILLIPVFVLAALQGAHTVAFFVFLAAAITDALDGYLARLLNQHSRLGAFLDPAADKSLLVSGYVVYTLPGVASYVLPLGLTFTVFIRDALLVIFAYLLYTRIRISRFPPSIPGKISTVCQVVTLAATVAANTFLEPLVAPLLFILYPLVLLITLFSGYDYMRRWNKVLLERE